MQIEVEIWSDNHGKDETFGTKPNQPHKICRAYALAHGTDVLEIILQAVRTILMPEIPDEHIHVIEMGSDAFGRGVMRMKIAESEFVCTAKIV